MKKIKADLFAAALVMLLIISCNGCGNNSKHTPEGEWSGFSDNMGVQGGIRARNYREMRNTDPLFSTVQQRLSYDVGKMIIPEYHSISVTKSGEQYFVTDTVYSYVTHVEQTDEISGRNFLWKLYYGMSNSPEERPVKYIRTTYTLKKDVIANKVKAEKKGHVLSAVIPKLGKQLYTYDEEHDILYAPAVYAAVEVTPTIRKSRNSDENYIKYMHDGLQTITDTYNQSVQKMLDEHTVYREGAAPYLIKTDDVSIDDSILNMQHVENRK